MITPKGAFSSVAPGCPRARWSLTALWLTAMLVAGCSHNGSGSATLPAASPAPQNAPAHARVSVTILVPRDIQHTRHPAYVSPATSALSISVNGATPIVVQLSPSSPDCTTTIQGLTCTVTVDAPVGQDSFAVTALDSSGNALSRATVPAAIVAGKANVLPLTLDGIVTQIVVILANPHPPVGTATTVPVLVSAQDAGKNTIIGPGGYDNPITLSDTDPQGVTKLSTATVSAPSATVTLSYDGQPMATPATIGAAAANVPASAVTSAVFAPAPSPSPAPSPTSSSAYVDWSTFGFDLARTGNNPSETTLGTSNVPNLHLLWSQNLGGATGGPIIAEPVVAQGVSIGGKTQNVLYVGTQTGLFSALNADNGAIIWQKTLGTTAYICSSYPFGIAGTATFDRRTNRVYVADGQDQLHALDMATGAEASGWPVTVATTPNHNFIYSALTFNPANGLIYAETSSTCDISPWYGRIDAFNTANGTLAGSFFPTQPQSGGGIWGYGGASIDSASNVYIAIGNADTSTGNPQNYGYAEDVAELSPLLSLLAANYPNLPASPDADFGATPILYQGAGCPAQLAAMNKSGVLVVYNRASITGGPVQTIQMSPSGSDAGNFIGLPAFSPVTNMLYVGVPSDSPSGTYLHGLAALQIDSATCTLRLGWQQTFGPNASTLPYDSPRSPPSVANGVVYAGDGTGRHVWAFSAQSGQHLWDSGSTITGQTFTQPVVDGGHLFVSSYGGTIYAFGP
ncbi:hypothetical protein EPN44_13555 [bacterium]|nr:MAG: hypothetical protein EPN44_13555 [bacterium]